MYIRNTHKKLYFFPLNELALCLGFINNLFHRYQFNIYLHRKRTSDYIARLHPCIHGQWLSFINSPINILSQCLFCQHYHSSYTHNYHSLKNIYSNLSWSTVIKWEKFHYLCQLPKLSQLSTIPLKKKKYLGFPGVYKLYKQQNYESKEYEFLCLP